MPVGDGVGFDIFKYLVVTGRGGDCGAGGHFREDVRGEGGVRKDGAEGGEGVEGDGAVGWVGIVLETSSVKTHQR